MADLEPRDRGSTEGRKEEEEELLLGVGSQAG